MPVSSKHREYLKHRKTWEKVEHAVEGGDAIKEGGYLREFDPPDEKRQEQYKKCSYYMNVTGRTMDALVGAIFRKEIKMEVPPAIEMMKVNFDGGGQGIEQIAKEVSQQLFQKARYGLYVDYPNVKSGMSAQEVRRLGLRPVISCYCPESIINWKTDVAGDRRVLSMVVLMETYEDGGDEFQPREKKRYRVLRLRDGVFTVQMYNEEDNPVSEEYAPRDGFGKMWDHIPFYFIGAENNLPSVDKAPLEALADLNIAHFQTTADHRENLFIHGQLTLGISSEISWQEFQKANPSGITVGARTGHFLGSNGRFTTATAPESSSLRSALQDLREEMAAIGAKLIRTNGQSETAETARINASAEYSVLDTMVDNMEEAFKNALEDAARYARAQGDVVVQFNRDYFPPNMDADDIMAQITLTDRGFITKKDVRVNLRRAGMLGKHRTDEELDEEAEDIGVQKVEPE